jgi:hypothetical protein
MPRGVAVSSNAVIEDLLSERLERFEDYTRGDVIAVDGPITAGFDNIVRQMVEHRLQNRRTRRQLLSFILQTDGGFFEVVQRTVAVLRKHYREVEFYVPNYAMSAGTVLVLSGDKIWMDYYSQLGPIDPQTENRDGLLVPALGYLEQYYRLIEKADDAPLNQAEEAFLIAKFDPGALSQYEHARELSTELVQDWLVKFKFKNWKRTRTRRRKVTPKMRRERAAEIAAKLSDTSTWHSHGRGIPMTVLRRTMKLQIDDFGADKELNSIVASYFKLFQDYGRRLGAETAAHTKDRYSTLHRDGRGDVTALRLQSR